jgi:two-component system, response regulator
MTPRNPILLAEDDANDVLLLRVAFEAVGLANALVVVRNGQEMIDYLRGTGAYRDREKYRQPSLVLLDLNMPGMDGFEVLAWRNTQKHLHNLPIIVLTSSNLQTDVRRAMDLGATAYRVKPGDFYYLKEVALELREQWFAEVNAAGPGLTALRRVRRSTCNIETDRPNSCSR